MGDGTFCHGIANYNLKLHKFEGRVLSHQSPPRHKTDPRYKRKPTSLKSGSKLNIFCNKQAEMFHKSFIPGREPQINPETALGAQVYF